MLGFLKEKSAGLLETYKHDLAEFAQQVKADTSTLLPPAPKAQARPTLASVMGGGGARMVMQRSEVCELSRSRRWSMAIPGQKGMDHGQSMAQWGGLTQAAAYSSGSS